MPSSSTRRCVEGGHSSGEYLGRVATGARELASAKRPSSRAAAAREPLTHEQVVEGDPPQPSRARDRARRGPHSRGQRARGRPGAAVPGRGRERVARGGIRRVPPRRDRSANGRDVLSRARPRRRALRHRRRPRQGGAGAVRHRGDEADERDRGQGGRGIAGCWSRTRSPSNMSALFRWAPVAPTRVHKILIAIDGESPPDLENVPRHGLRTVCVLDRRRRSARDARRRVDRIGPPEPRRAIEHPSIISAASITECERSPGYGLLSENPVAEVAGPRHQFIGPSRRGHPAHGRQGAGARKWPGRRARRSSGSQGPLDGVDEAQALATKSAIPSWSRPIPAGAAGGGHRPRSANRWRAAYATCQPQRTPPSDPPSVLEKFVRRRVTSRSRCWATETGSASQGERDCSIQRRHQKLLEESPATSISPATRAGLCNPRSLSPMPSTTSPRARWSPRRPRRQLLLHRDETRGSRWNIPSPSGHRLRPRPRADPHAAGESLGSKQDTIKWSGHAIECGSRPRTRALHSLSGPRHGLGCLPAGLGPCGQPPDGRLRGAAHYDSLVAKIIVHARDRAEAVTRGTGRSPRPCGGVKTTIPFHLSSSPIRHSRGRVCDPPIRAALFDERVTARLARAARGLLLT